MTQRSFFWNGTTVGDADTYTKYMGYQLGNVDYEAPLTDIVLRMLFNATGNRGILRGWGNELEVTGAASPIEVDTGAALVYGMPYENTTDKVQVTVPNPTNDVRYDLIVLRRNWTAQTIRVTRIAGVEGGSVPLVIQSASPAGSGIYDIPLASLSITTGGVITLTDAREYIIGSTAAVADSIDTAAIIDNGADLFERSQTLKTLRLGGSELLPFVGYFSYKGPPDYAMETHYQSWNEATWGGTSTSMEGWLCTGTGYSTYYGFVVAFSIPADYVPDSGISVILWTIDDWTGTSSWSIDSCWQAYREDTEVIYSQANTVTNVTHEAEIDNVATHTLASIDNVQAGDMVLYFMRYYNSAGSEAVLLGGLEVVYGAYT